MKRSKPYIIAGIVLIAAVIIVLAGTFFIERYIENELKNMEVGKYQIQINHSKARILQRSVEINEVVVENTSAGITVKIPSVKATGIGLFPLLFNDRVIVNKVVVQQPEFILIQQEAVEDKDIEESTASEADTDIDFIRIKKLEIGRAAFLLQNQRDQDLDTVFSIQAGVDLWNLTINSDRGHLTFNDHSAERFQMRMQQGMFNLPGGLYRLVFETLSLDSEKAVLEIENLGLKSRHPKFEIWRHTGTEIDWFDINIPQLVFHGIDIQSSLQDTAVVFRKALLNNMNAHIFRNKKPPFPEKPDTKLPMEMLESLPFGFHADSILIKSSKVTYEELGEESSETGVITFNQLYATIYNLSTIDSLITGQTGMSARARIMNSALLEAEFTFPNRQTYRPYRASGRLEPVRIETFNPILVPSAFVRVEDGQIQRLEFEFTYNTNKSEGNLELEYEDLKITILDKDDGSKKTIKTFIAQTFLLDKDNLEEERSYKEGSISFERDKKRSIFNYWWKSLFSGMKDILGF
jgi:hypothetical protein